MKIRQPLVLLLGGLLSSSTVGCASINAIVSEHRAASTSKSASSERMVAIGRVFENQGRLDQAEVMYRRALKKDPNNSAIRDQLQQLADKRNGRKFGPGSVESAIAMADSVTGRTTSPPRSSQPLPAVRQKNSSLPQPTPETIQASLVASVPNASFVEQVSAVNTNPTAAISANQILEIIDSPEANRDLLLNGLSNVDSAETRCLSATLLGDCDPSNEQTREALKAAASSETDAQVRLSIADSQIQRGEASEETAACLIELLQNPSREIQIQAGSDLRYFGGTPSEAKCVTALTGLLSNSDDSLRAMAAVTLGEFGDLDSATISTLKVLAESDSSNAVREAAHSAVSRVELVSFTE